MKATIKREQTESMELPESITQAWNAYQDYSEKCILKYGRNYDWDAPKGVKGHAQKLFNRLFRIIRDAGMRPETVIGYLSTQGK